MEYDLATTKHFFAYCLFFIGVVCLGLGLFGEWLFDKWNNRGGM